MRQFFFAAALSCVTVALGGAALAHGFAGQRFFPATILTDDPFVADEGSLPTVTRNPDATDDSQETDFEFDLSKRVTPNTDITLQDQWEYVQVKNGKAVQGLSGLETGAQYQLFVDAAHEAIGLADITVTWAHTGRVQALGAPDFTTLSPTFDFGKGLGDLPDTLGFLRPIAVTGNLAVDFPTKTESAGTANPNNFDYGFAFEYSLPYLECCVKDIGLRRPFSQMIPLVEIGFTTPINRAQGYSTIGTVQPGIIWSGQYFQIGAEAIIPATRATGHGIGGLVQLHFYLDDLFPRSFGRPISEWGL